MMENVESAGAAVKQNTEAMRSDLEILRRQFVHSRERAAWPRQRLAAAKRWWGEHLTEEDRWLVPRIGGALALAFILRRWREKRRN